MNSELLKKSTNFKLAAEQLLQDSKLLDFLTPYGEIKFVGGYQFNLMLSGDIDIHVYINDFKTFTKEKLFELLNKLLKQYYFQAYKIDDYVKWPNKRLPYGYYLGLRTTPEGYMDRWKIDIWFILKDSDEGEKNFERLNKMNNKQRLAILEFKDYRCQNKLEFPSIIIYDAVLGNNILDIELFKKYLKNNLRSW